MQREEKHHQAPEEDSDQEVGYFNIFGNSDIFMWKYRAQYVKVWLNKVALFISVSVIVTRENFVNFWLLIVLQWEGLTPLVHLKQFRLKKVGKPNYVK